MGNEEQYQGTRTSVPGCMHMQEPFSHHSTCKLSSPLPPAQCTDIQTQSGGNPGQAAGLAVEDGLTCWRAWRGGRRMAGNPWASPGKASHRSRAGTARSGPQWCCVCSPRIHHERSHIQLLLWTSRFIDRQLGSQAQTYKPMQNAKIVV